MNDNRPLHPNLARLAASYDEVMRQYANGRLDAAGAKACLRALEARDDEGVVWSLDPDSGNWRYRSRSGSWVAAPPPSSGVATLTPHDLSRDPGTFNPDSRISFTEAPVEQHGLRGSVRGKVGTPEPAVAGATATKLVALVVTVVLASIAWASLPRPAEVPPTPPTDSAPVERSGVEVTGQMPTDTGS